VSVLPGSFRGKEWDYWISLWTVALAAVAVLGVPIFAVILASVRGPAEYLPIENGARWTLENFRYVYGEPRLYKDIVPNTLILAIGSVAFSGSIALALGWYVERAKLRRPILTRMLILAPMALPTPALAVAWIRLLGPNEGWVNQIFNLLVGSDATSGPFDIFTMTGLIWCQGLASVPMAYLLMAPAVRAVSYAMEESAYVGGAMPGKTFIRIGIPIMVKPLLGPMLIMFLIALEQVDFPYILGPTAGINVLGTRMLWEVVSPIGLPNMGATAALALIVLVVAIVGLVGCDRLTLQRQSGAGGLSGNRLTRTWLPRWCVKLIEILLFGYFAIALLMPLGVLLASAIGGVTGASLHVAAECCGNGFKHIFNEPRFLTATVNTLIVAGSSAAIATLIGFSIAICSNDGRSKVARALDRISITSIGLPSLLVAFGTAVVFLSIPIGLYGTIGLLIVAYSYRIALSSRMAKAGLAQIPGSLQEAAEASGVRWFRVQMHVVLPLVAPSVVASVAILFVVGVREFTIPMMLYSPDNVVLSVLLLQFQQAGNQPAAAATGIVMTAITMLGVCGLLFADHRYGRSRGER
jgi:iron(III) transport system permease protein